MTLILINSILPSLPIDSAIRIGTLSKRWTHLWKYIEVIRFPLLPEVTFEPNYDYVDSCLALHQAQTVEKFSLIAYVNVRSFPNIKNWVDFAIFKRVRELHLSMEVALKNASPCSCGICGHYFRYDYFKLSDSFYLSDTNKYLEHVALSGVYIRPEFSGFASLRKLVLYDCGVSDDGLVQILSTCPLLESLGMFKCRGTLSNIRVSSTVLKEFEYSNYPSRTEGTCEINAPNLVHFQGFNMDTWITVFDISCNPLHVQFHISRFYDDDEMKQLLFGILMEKIANVEFLGINTEVLEFISRVVEDDAYEYKYGYGYGSEDEDRDEYDPHITFTNLKDLYYSMDEIDLVHIFSFLRYCPSLNNLQLEFRDVIELVDGVPKAFPPRSRGVVTYENEILDQFCSCDREKAELLSEFEPFLYLKKIELFFYSGSCWGDEHLLAHIFSKAINLERILLFFEGPKHHYMKTKHEPEFTPDVKQKILEGVSLLPKASPHVQVLLG